MNEIESIILSTSEERKEGQVVKNKNASNAARDLLKNGILVQTSKGLVCMSLKDALNKGVGGHNLSAEDFKKVATELLFQQEPEEMIVPESVSLWTETARKPQKVHKEGNKSTINKPKSWNKIPVACTVPDPFSTSQVDLEEFKDIQDSLLGFSSLEYSFLEKATEESEESNISRVDKKFTEFDNSVLVEAASKKPLVNKRSLILKKNNIKPVISVQKIIKNISHKKNETVSKYNGLESVLISSNSLSKEPQVAYESYVSNEETSDNSEVTFVMTDEPENKPVKKRGGWPKGRKRKPEIKYEIRPPKAPATGYVIFLNEKRKDYRDMPFTEVTKLLGNEWSKLSLQDKKVYLDQAEVEKKRYREELKLYRQSDAYQTYLNKKRLKRLQGNGTEESDMDATDEIDEEDNEELYCRSCDQWFHSLHNKKEHLYGRQHLQSIAGRYTKMSDPDWCNANMSSTSLDESSLDGSSYLKGNKDHCCTKNKESLNMDDAIVRFMVANKEREEERKVLRAKLDESKGRNQALCVELQQLNETVDSLTCMVESERTTQILLEQRLFNLLNVPTLFYLPEPLSEENN